MNGVRLFTILYCATLAVAVALRHADQSRYLKLRGELDVPARVLGRWPVPRLTAGQFHVAGASFLTATTLACVGIHPRAALCLAIALYFVYFGQILGVSYVHRKSNLVPVILFVLAVAPGTDEGMARRSPPWPLLIVQAALAQSYLTSGFCKIREMGVRWAPGAQMQGILLFHHLYYDLKASVWLAERIWLCRVLSVLALTFELTFWTVLLVPEYGWVFLLAGLTFHLGTLGLMRIDYLTYQGPAFLVFLVGPIGRALSGHWIK